MLKLPKSVIQALQESDNLPSIPIQEKTHIANVNQYDKFEQLIANNFLTLKSQEVIELCRTIFNSVSRNEFNSSLSSGLIMLFTTIDDYYILIEDRDRVDEMEHNHYKTLLAGVEGDIKITDDLAKYEKAMYTKLKAEGKTIEAFQSLLSIKKLAADRAKLMKEQYKYMVAISTKTYRVKGDDLVIKKRKDLLLMRINIVKMLGDFNLTPKTIQVTSKGVNRSALADLLDKGMNNG